MREHLMVVQMVSSDGYRFWSGDMPESDVNAYIDSFTNSDYMLDDVDHAANCWCNGGSDYAEGLVSPLFWQ